MRLLSSSFGGICTLLTLAMLVDAEIEAARMADAPKVALGQLITKFNVVNEAKLGEAQENLRQAETAAAARRAPPRAAPRR